MDRFRFLLIAIAAPFVLAACGGGGGASEVSTAGEPATVAVLMADSTSADAAVQEVLDEVEVPEGEIPEDDRGQLIATITSVVLLGDGGKETIYNSADMAGDDGKDIDLFDLQSGFELFFVNEAVAPGVYSKIRLQASSVKLFSDEYPTGANVKLPSGHIDFNPSGDFEILAGDVVYLKLDVDANKSLKLNFNPQKIILRPVVFVDIDTEPAFDEGFVRVSGIVESTATDGGSFRICEPEVTIQPLADTEDGESAANGICIDVIVGDKTGLFGPDGTPVEVTDLEPGDPVTVIGYLQKTPDEGEAEVTPLADEETDNPTPFQILAVVVEGGFAGTWDRYRGAVEAPVDATTLTFPFRLAGEQDELLQGQLYAKTRIFRLDTNEGLSEIAPDAIAVGERAVVEAVRVPAPEPKEGEEAEEPLDTLRVALMLVVAEPESLPDIERGKILSIDTSDGALLLATETTPGGACVVSTESTIVLQVVPTGNEDDPVNIIKVMFSDLLIGARTVAVGSLGSDSCLSAKLIVSEGPVKP